MVTISDSLTPDCVALNLTAPDQAAAIHAVAALLQHTPEVLDWKMLFTGLQKACPCIAETGGDFAVCLPHARTDAVNAIVISVGRLQPGLPFEGCAPPVRYIFCIGAPKALASDYPRIVGLLSRIFKNPESEAQLCSAATPAQFIERLAVLEAKL